MGEEYQKIIIVKIYISCNESEHDCDGVTYSDGPRLVLYIRKEFLYVRIYHLLIPAFL